MADTMYAAPVVPGQEGAARAPRARADKVLMGRVHLARRPAVRRGDFLGHVPSLQPERRPRWRWRLR